VVVAIHPLRGSETRPPRFVCHGLRGLISSVLYMLVQPQWINQGNDVGYYWEYYRVDCLEG
jgi:hypothetical protein